MTSNLKEQKRNLIRELESLGIKDNKVINAIQKTKRELFMPEKFKDFSYENCAFPIQVGQTISQPYTVAKMLDLLEIKPGNKILEIGAGSGYNAAVMSILTGNKGKIYTLEIQRELCNTAKKNLEKSDTKNVEVIKANGFFGYEKETPYDKIIVTAGTPIIPKSLLKQLRKGGTMVIPISNSYGETMTKITKEDKLKKTTHGDFSFVPMTGTLND